MSNMTKVSEVLAEYVGDDGTSISQQKGPEAVVLAKEMFQLVVEKLQTISLGSIVLNQFKIDPEQQKALLRDTLDAQDEAFRQALNDFLTRFEAIQAKSITPGPSNYKATIQGTGSVIQGSTINAGQGAIVGSTAGDNIITGSGNQVNTTVHHHERSRVPYKGEAVDSPYRLDNISTLFKAGFNEGDLRRLCQYQDNFRALYDEVARLASKAEIVDQVIAYADENVLIPELLAWAEAQNPRRYEMHKPYQK